MDAALEPDPDDGERGPRGSQGDEFESAVPFSEDLPVPLYPGRLISVEGFVHPAAVRMSINLVCGSNGDVAFHLNPRFDQNYVARNCRLGNRWFEEEGAAACKSPFHRGQPFTVRLLVDSDKFMVAVNGTHLCAFSFRVPLHRITKMEVHGNVILNVIEHSTTERYPDVRPEDSKTVYRLPLEVDENAPLVTPFTAHLSHPLDVGSSLEVYGRVKLLPHSFYINLQQGHNIWPHPRIPLHFNPRFKSGHTVARNTWTKGKWGYEDKISNSPFRPGRPFVLKIVCKTDEYAISIDGVEMQPYKHRAPPEIVDSVIILGDVSIKDITYK